MKLDHKHEKWLWVAGVGGGGLLLLVVLDHNHKTGSSQVLTHAPATGHVTNSPRSMPNPGQAQLDMAVLSAKEAAMGMYDQSAVTEQATQAGLDLGINTNMTNKLVAFNQDAAAIKMTGLTTAAQQAIAQEQALAQEQIAQTYIQPYNTMANAQAGTSWLTGIGSFLGSIFPFLGSSFGGAWQTPGGMGSYNPSTQQYWTQSGVPFLP